MVTDPKSGLPTAANLDACQWVGNVGWVLIALSRLRRGGFHDDPSGLALAVDRGAAWLAGQAQYRGNSTYPGLISLGTEGNISAYFGLLAAGKASEASLLANAIYQFAWDPVQRRLMAGVTDAATAIDVSGTWGVTFLRSTGHTKDALDSQSYAASIMRVCSFGGSICAYGDIAGPYTPAVEFTAQAAAAGIKDADTVMQQIALLQIAGGGTFAGTFPGGPDHWYGGSLTPWVTTMAGVSPTAWVYFAHHRDPLLDIAGLRITKTHRGALIAGQRRAAYQIEVSNVVPGPSTGAVTVSETPSTGLTLISMTGSGWTCANGGNSCTRSDALASGAAYPSIAAIVDVAPGAVSPQTNAAAVSAGGSVLAATSDPTTILPSAADVGPSDFFFDAVNLMRQYGITSGCAVAPPMYCPGDNVTRAQMAIFIVRSAMGGDNFAYSPTPYFGDVAPADFGFKWIQKMFELGITAGCGSGNYCPDHPVTRGQMAIFVIRTRLGSAADGSFSYPATPAFTDVDASHPYFKWIQRMKQDQITAGCGSGSLYCPDDPVTRGQMAIFIMRGGFNQLLPSGTALLVTSNPASAAAGQTTTVTVTGVDTHFAQGVTQVSAGPGITVGSVTVTSLTTLSCQLMIAANAAAGPRTLLAVTGSEEAVLPNGLTIP